MDFDYISLKTQISMYLNHKITLYELGYICENVYYNIIKGDYIYLNNIFLYPFLRVLYKINLKDNDIKDEYSCDELEIFDIYDILIGNKNASYIMSIGIPQTISKKVDEIYRKKITYYNKLKDVLLKYLKKQALNKEDILTIDKTLDKIPFREDDCTIFDVLDNYIFTLMKYISVESNVLEITCCLNLYMRKPLNKDDIIKKIIFAIDCYTGEKDIDVQIVFDRGKPRLNTFFVNI